MGTNFSVLMPVILLLKPMVHIPQFLQDEHSQIDRKTTTIGVKNERKRTY